MAEPIARQRLPIRTKLSYGIGDLGPSVCTTIVGFWFLWYLINIARVDLLLASVAYFIGKVWDAINDPLMGSLTDHTRSRWGRRRPFLLFGAIPYALGFAMLWVRPPLENQLLLCAYYALAFIIYDTAFTAVSVPYTALTPELTADYDERTSLNAYRMAVSIITGLLPFIFVKEIVGSFPDPRQGYTAMGLIFGAISALPFFIVFLGTREKRELQKEAPHTPLREALRDAFRNRPFVIVMCLYVLTWTAVSIVQAIFRFFLLDWMKIGEAQGDYIMAVVFISAALCLPLWVKVSERLGKRWTFALGISFWAGVQLALIFLPPGAVVAAYILAFLAGVGISVAHLLPWSIIPDVLEEEEVRSGERREGVYYGLVIFLEKIAFAANLLVTGQALKLSGYLQPTDAVPSPVQPASALWAIRILMGPVPALFLLLAIFFAYLYPITREKHEEMRRQLDARRKAMEGQE